MSFTNPAVGPGGGAEVVAGQGCAAPTRSLTAGEKTGEQFGGALLLGFSAFCLFPDRLKAALPSCGGPGTALSPAVLGISHKYPTNLGLGLCGDRHGPHRLPSHLTTSAGRAGEARSSATPRVFHTPINHKLIIRTTRPVLVGTSHPPLVVTSCGS